MLTERQRQELADKLVEYFRHQWGAEFTDSDVIEINDFCWDKVTDDDISYPFHEDNIANVAIKFELST